MRSLRGGRSTCATPKIRSREITLRARVRIKSPFPASTSLTTIGCLLLFRVDVKSIRDDRISGSTSTFLGCYLYLYLFLMFVVLLSKPLSSLLCISFTLWYSSSVLLFISTNVDKNVGHTLPDVTSVHSSEILIAQVQFVSLCLNLNERHVPDLKSCHAPSSSPVSVSDYDAPPRGSPRCLDVRACV